MEDQDQLAPTILIVLIVEDHFATLAAMRELLSTAFPGCRILAAESAEQAIELCTGEPPHVVIMDIAMPNLNGIQATTQVVKKNPQIGVIILSMYSDETYLTRTLAAGAKGYLLKDSADVDLDRAVQVVAQGKPFFSPAIADTLLEDYMRQLKQRGLQDSYDLLTEREKEILQLLAEGRSNKEAAGILNLSINTIETHRTRIMQKLNLHSAADIVLYAVRKRIIS